MGKYINRKKAHLGKGVKHLAIAVLIFNKAGKVLLQKRKHKVFNNIWDLTGATHPLHLKNGDETFEEATKRCLKREWGISPTSSTSGGLRGIKKVGAFSYFAQDGKRCENEYCALMVGEYDGKIKLNKEVGYGYKWRDKEKFLEDIKKNPYKYSAWAVEGMKILVASDL